MTEDDVERLADFDARAAGWGFYDNEAGWPKIHHDALFLRRLLRESEAECARRQTALIEIAKTAIAAAETLERPSDA